MHWLAPRACVHRPLQVDWKASIPYRLLATGRFMCSALDETNTRRFLPTYLAKCAPPRDVVDPMAIARMVHCITFAQDSHLATGSRKGAEKTVEEVWSSPNYFLDVKKGASEDHAVLQCNLFLGLGLDAYIAIGRLPGGVQQHVWVVTREPNGDILFWETTKGDFCPSHRPTPSPAPTPPQPLAPTQARAARAIARHARRRMRSLCDAVPFPPSR